MSRKGLVAARCLVLLALLAGFGAVLMPWGETLPRWGSSVHRYLQPSWAFVGFETTLAVLIASVFEIVLGGAPWRRRPAILVAVLAGLVAYAFAWGSYFQLVYTGAVVATSAPQTPLDETVSAAEFLFSFDSETTPRCLVFVNVFFVLASVAGPLTYVRLRRLGLERQVKAVAVLWPVFAGPCLVCLATNGAWDRMFLLDADNATEAARSAVVAWSCLIWPVAAVSPVLFDAFGPKAEIRRVRGERRR